MINFVAFKRFSDYYSRVSDSFPTVGRIISAMLLVTGTTIGGGMLALPVATGLNGFFPSIAIMALCCMAMITTALLLLEVTLWFGEGAHIMTMTSTILGRWGKLLSMVVYLFICYASIVAYTAGGGVQVAAALNHYLGSELTNDSGACLFLALFYSVIYMGSRIVGRVNTMLFVAMIFAYILLIGVGIDEIRPSLLSFISWKGSLMAVPLLLTSFSFQTMVPSLVPYLNRHVKPLRIAIVGGTLFTFTIYAIWQALILGIIPVEGDNGLAQALYEGSPATIFLYQHVTGTWVATAAEFFAFFAIGTSFLGMTFGLIDFLADGIGIEKKGKGKVILGLLIVVPTLIIATQFERVFLIAMDTTGGFGDTILNGMIPVMMIWIGRYKLGYSSKSPTFGGKGLLVLTFAFFFFAFCIECIDRAGIYRQVTETYEILEIHNPEAILQGT